MGPAADATLPRPARTRAWLRALVAVFAGLVGWALVGEVGLLLLRAWPDYALAAPTKAFTLPMLLARLSLGATATVAAGAASALVARGDRSAVWGVGVLLLALSLRVHLFQIWGDYPAWYHVVYLAYLLPLALLGGRLAGRS